MILFMVNIVYFVHLFENCYRLFNFSGLSVLMLRKRPYSETQYSSAPVLGLSLKCLFGDLTNFFSDLATFLATLVTKFQF